MPMKETVKICTKYEQVFEWLGKRWNGLIIRCLSQGPMRFSEIARCIEACSDKVLTERLKELEEIGLIVVESPYYALSSMGQELNEALNGLQDFANKHL